MRVVAEREGRPMGGSGGRVGSTVRLDQQRLRVSQLTSSQRGDDEA